MQIAEVDLAPRDGWSLYRDNSKPVFIWKKALKWFVSNNFDTYLYEMTSLSFPVAYASIDWHDFVVVETVDYQPNETGNLPPPTTPEEVGARIIAQARFEENPAGVIDKLAILMFHFQRLCIISIDLNLVFYSALYWVPGPVVLVILFSLPMLY